MEKERAENERKEQHIKEVLEGICSGASFWQIPDIDTRPGALTLAAAHVHVDHPPDPREFSMRDEFSADASISVACYRFAHGRHLARSSKPPRICPPRGALIGLDLGTKTIGVASSDPDRRLATGVETIARKNFTADARRLLALAAERAAVGFVLGLPVNMDGTRARARNRPAPSRAISPSSPNCRSRCGTSGCPPPRSSAN